MSRSKGIAMFGLEICTRRGVFLFGLALLVLEGFSTPSLAADGSVHFWITSSNTSTTGAPIDQASVDSIESVNGSTRYLHIWAQPALVNPALPLSASNPLKQLQNFSLNLWLDNATAASFPRNEATYIDDTTKLASPGSVVVHNPTINSSGTKRFEHVRDSAANNESDGIPVQVEYSGYVPYPYRILGVAGYSITGTSHGVGGASCGTDAYCAMTPTGPAWEIATVAVNAGESGSADLHLQVGSLGINQAVYNPASGIYTRESTSQTSVVFGANGTPYNGYDELPAHPGDGTPEFTLRVGTPTPIQVGTSASWSVLGLGGSVPTGRSDVTITGGLVTVTGSQAGNKAIVNGGRLHVASGGSLASDVVVNTGGSVSGDGWLNGSLTLNGVGKLSIAASGALKVVGAANILGGSLDIAAGYSPPVGQEFAALTATGGLQCGQVSCAQAFAATAGQSLGSGLTLESIRYTSQSIFVKFAAAGLAGDFNSDGKVDAADYVNWRKTNNTPTGYSAWRGSFNPPAASLAGDFNGNNAVDAADYVKWRKAGGSPADYNTWRSNFGRVSGVGTGLEAISAVPEPSCFPLALVSISYLMIHRSRAHSRRLYGRATHSACSIKLRIRALTRLHVNYRWLSAMLIATAISWMFCERVLSDTKYWDINGASAGAGGSTPSGPWDTSTSNWSTDPTGSLSATTWQAGDSAVFSAGTNATGSYNVFVVGIQSLSGLTVEEGTVQQASGKLDFGAANGVIDIASGATWNATSSDRFAGTGGITKTGAGILSLAGSQTFSNASGPILTINGGIVDITSDTSLGTLVGPVRADALLLNGGTLRVGASGASLQPNRGITLGANGGTLNVNSTGVLSIPGIISGAGSLTKVGNSTATPLFLNGANTFTGGFNLNAGLVMVGTDTSLGAANSPVTLGGNSILRAVSGGSRTLTYAYTLNGNVSLGNSLTLAGTMNLGGGTRTITTENFPTTISAPISNGALVKAGPATLILTGNNTYTGSTTISTGTLQIGSGGASGSLSSTNVLNSSALVFNRGTDYGFSGNITGSGSVAKSGAGTLTLTGASTYTGATAVNAGTLLANNSSGSATGSGTLTVAGNATLGGTGAISNPTVINSSGAIAPGVGIGALRVNNNLTLANGSIFRYEFNSQASNPNLFSDLLNVNGNLSIGSTAQLSLVALGSGNIPLGTKMSVLSYSGAWNGTPFMGLPDQELTLFNGQQFKVDYNDPNGGGNFGGGAFGKHVTLTAVAADYLVSVDGIPVVNNGGFDFGSRFVNDLNPTLTLDIQNTGNLTLELSDLHFGGPFRIVTAPTSIAPQSSGRVVLDMNTNSLGSFNNTISFGTNLLGTDPDKTFAFQLGGTVVPPEISSIGIYQWEFINQSDPSQGVKQSTTLCLGGSGVSAIPGANLSSRDLTMAHLVGANLGNANLTGSNLTSANFTGATILGANLRAATANGFEATQLYSTSNYQSQNLTSVNLSESNLSGWNFHGQKLTNASLASSIVAGADFSDAKIDGANFASTTSRGFTSAQLYSTSSYQSHDVAGVNLSGNNLVGWNFASQNLTNASFASSNISGASFSNAQVQGANFNSAGISSTQLYSTFTYANGVLGNVDLGSNDLTGWNFVRQDLRNASFASATLKDVNFTKANIRGANFSATTDKGFTATQFRSTVSFTTKDLSGINLSNNDLRGWIGFLDNGLNFANADFSNSNLSIPSRGSLDPRRSYFLYDNLTSANFTQANASNAVFTSAILTNANFSNANLTGAYLSGASVVGANFTGARIAGAELTSGFTLSQLYSTASYQAHNLTGTRFGGNDFSGGNFTGQNLTDASLSGAKLAGADFAGSIVRNANLGDLTANGFTATQLYSTASYQAHELGTVVLFNNDMSGWSFANQNLEGALFGHDDPASNLGSTLIGTNFSGANLRKAEVLRSNLTNADLRLANLSNAKMFGSDFTGADLREAKLTGATFFYGFYGLTSNLTNAKLARSDVDNAQFDNAILTGANFSEATGRNASFSGVNASNVNFSRATLSGAYFNYSTLTNSDFSASNLSNATFYGATVNGAVFTDANIRGTDLYGVLGFTAAQLYSTESYKSHDLNGTGFGGLNVAGWDFSAQNLANAGFVGANVAATSFSGAQIKGANFYETTSSGFTENQLYSTASYQAHDLSGVVLSGNDLSGWNFGGQNLRNAGFVEANVSGANFTGASIEGANFGDYSPSAGSFSAGQLYSTASYQNRDLSGVGLDSKDLSGWNFSQQKLIGASFSGAVLSGANFSGAFIQGANFDDFGTDGSGQLTVAQLYSTASYQTRDLSGVGFSGNSVTGWNFSGQNLTRARFNARSDIYNSIFEADFSDANLSESSLLGARVGDTNFSRANLTNATLRYSFLINSNFNNAKLIGADLSGSRLTGSAFTNADLTDCDLSHAEAGEAFFNGAQITGANFQEAGLTAAQLYSTASYQAHDLRRISLALSNVSGWNFAGQNLSAAQLWLADLTGANFGGANLTNADLTYAELTDANFTGSILRGASFTSLSPSQLYSTASYQGHDLTAIRLQQSMAGWNFSNQNLSDAVLSGSVAGANFTNADIRGARFTSSDLTAAQFYSTASYQMHDLTGIDLSDVDLTGWNFSGQSFAGSVSDGRFANFQNADLTDVDFIGASLDNADMRGATGANLAGTLSSTGLIRADGHVGIIQDSATIRNYTGDVIGIHVDQSMSLSPSSRFQVVFGDLISDNGDENAWNSTISFATGSHATLGGTLDLRFSIPEQLNPNVVPTTQVGRKFQLYDWNGITPVGQFNNVASQHGWDVSQLQSTGSITLTAMLVDSTLHVHGGLVSNNLAGPGVRLLKTTAGIATLSGNNTYTGGTSIADGTLQIGSGGTTGSLSDVGGVANDGLLIFNRSNAYTYGGTISGIGAVTQAGSGTLTLTSDHTYAGVTTVQSGTLQIGDGGLTGSLAGPIVNNAAVIFNRGNAFTYSGTIMGSGAVTKAGIGTLTLAGTNNYTGGTTIANGRLAVNGSIQGPVGINFAGTLAGNGTIHGNVTSGGRVAPGNSPGILHINGNYTQTTTSSLEIEVGGLTPGTEHDQVQVTGNAALDGTFTFPLVNNPTSGTLFHPQLNDEITFLTANSITGAPKGVFAPNLATIDPNIGFVVIKNNQDLRLRFVAPTDVHFVDNSGATTQDWNQSLKWDVNRVPNTADKIELTRSQAPSVQRIEVTSADAAAYNLSIHDPSSPITVGINNDKTLAAAVGDVTIGQNAAIELGNAGNVLDSGTLAVADTRTVRLESGGVLKGNGTVSAGTLAVVNGTVSPGFAVGQLDIEGNYNQQISGRLLVDVMGANGAQHDQVDVSGQAQLSGTLTVNAAGFELGTIAAGTYGQPIPILDADGRSGKFTNVETTGNNNVRFFPVYPAPGSGAEPAPGSNTSTAPSCGVDVCVAGFLMGDMNHNGVVNQGDIPYFAMALSDPVKYSKQLAWNGSLFGDTTTLGDFVGREGTLYHGDNRLTFDDINAFAQILGMSQTGFAAAMQLQAIPEPTPAQLVLLGCLITLPSSRRRKSLISQLHQNGA